MGKFLKDNEGQFVAISGSPVLRKIIQKRPKDCESCGFAKWVQGDSCYIVHRQEGGLQWLCPDCALDQGLPVEHYQRTRHSPRNTPTEKVVEGCYVVSKCTSDTMKQTSDLSACLCYF